MRENVEEKNDAQLVVLLEGVVKEEDWEDLMRLHSETKFLPPGLLSSVLIQGKDDPSEWKMINTWESAEAFAAANSADGRPSGEHMFEAMNSTLGPSSFFVARSTATQKEAK